jgi:paraquat-inducible protein B
MSLQRRPVLVGAFVLGTLVLTVVVILVVGSGRLFQRSDTVVSFFDESVTGLSEGAPVLYRGVRVGQVTNIAIHLIESDRPHDDFRVAVVYEIDHDRLQSRAASLEMDDAWGSIDDLVERGLHAKLEVESFVTGRLSLGLDIDPRAASNYEPVPGLAFPEIPAVPAALQRMQTQVNRILDSIEEMDMGAVIVSLEEATKGLAAVLGSPGLESSLQELPALVAEMRETFALVRTTLESTDTRDLVEATSALAREMAILSEEATATLGLMRNVLHPEGVTIHRLNDALSSLDAAADAVARLAGELERDPSALVRGKEGRQ